MGTFIGREIVGIDALNDIQKFPLIFEIEHMNGEFKYMEGDYLVSLKFFENAEALYNKFKPQFT